MYNVYKFILCLAPVWVGLARSSLYMACATLAYLCLVSGVLLRRQTGWHRRFMLTGISLDLIIVLALELSRSAVATSLNHELNTYQMLHIISSVAAVLLYMPTLVLGQLRWKKLKGGGGRAGGPPGASPGRESVASSSLVKAHLVCGVAAFVCRSIGWLFMFAW